MKQLAIQNIQSLGTILSVWAHPDDESFLAGGLLSMAAANGQKVICVTATRGEAGSHNEARWPAATIGEVRTKELKIALDILGLKHHHWLSYCDGTCHEVTDDEAVAEIIKLIEHYQPDTMLTFSPDGMTGHLDHQAVSRWSRLAIEKSGHNITLYYGIDTQEQYDLYMKALDKKFDVYFNLEKPTLVPGQHCDICLELPQDITRKKMESLRAMPSQTDVMFQEMGDDWFMRALSREAFVLASRSDIHWNRGPFKRRKSTSLS